VGILRSQIATLTGCEPGEVTRLRRGAGVPTVFKTVDTCAAEFEASTPYHYSTYEDTSEVELSSRDRVIILGSGPNRIGQGIEFDYCCVHASMALRDMGYETVMVNCNPETVSTDYSTSDRLYFEPLTPEDLAEVILAEQAACTNGARVVGVIVALGDRRPSSCRTVSSPRWCSGRRSPPSTPPRTVRGGRQSVRHWAFVSLRVMSR